ncbi:hypothetical protein, partial [Escherichia coli]|uniref:hypothetical protein n=1 Tax=Escherichia coli TaxID=562 RepID=UPI001BC830BB
MSIRERGIKVRRKKEWGDEKEMEEVKVGKKRGEERRRKGGRVGGKGTKVGKKKREKKEKGGGEGRG